MGTLESSARAHLCRRLAEFEPHNRDLWLAEADRWSRLAQTEQQAEPPEPDLQGARPLNKRADALRTWLRKSA